MSADGYCFVVCSISGPWNTSRPGSVKGIQHLQVRAVKSKNPEHQFYLIEIFFLRTTQGARKDGRGNDTLPLRNVRCAETPEDS